MKFYTDLRAEYPNIVFVTKSLPCADGITRLVTLAEWFWKKLDILLEVSKSRDLDFITDACLSHAHKFSPRYDPNFDKVFCELLMYYIHNNYYGYFKFSRGIANDFWKPLIPNDRADPRTGA